MTKRSFVRRTLQSILVGAALPLLLAAGPASPSAKTAPASGEIMVSAAASLKDVMKDIAPAFEKANPGAKLVFNFAASGQLMTQIEGGAPVDVFVSAAMADVDTLEKKGLLAAETRQVIARNSLVLIRNKANHPPFATCEDLTKEDVKRIAVGSEKTVPAGRYAKETLEARKLYDKLKTKLVFAENVRQVLDYVARGEADAGFVYKTDAMIEPKTEVVEAIPADQHKPIVYPAAVLKAVKNVALAKKFVEFLKSPDATNAFKKLGFE